MNKIFIWYFIFGLTLFSCREEKTQQNIITSEYKPLDLMDKGIPLKVNVPEGTIVKVDVESFYKDITLKDNKDYFIQIIATEAFTNNIQDVKIEMEAEVRKNPFFSKMNLEEENGFIFEKKTNDTTFNYDFRYIKLESDQQYVFQAGLYGLFTKDQVKNMYESVK